MAENRPDTKPKRDPSELFGGKRFDIETRSQHVCDKLCNDEGHNHVVEVDLPKNASIEIVHATVKAAGIEIDEELILFHDEDDDPIEWHGHKRPHHIKPRAHLGLGPLFRHLARRPLPRRTSSIRSRR